MVAWAQSWGRKDGGFCWYMGCSEGGTGGVGAEEGGVGALVVNPTGGKLWQLRPYAKQRAHVLGMWGLFGNGIPTASTPSGYGSGERDPSCGGCGCAGEAASRMSPSTSGEIADGPVSIGSVPWGEEKGGREAPGCSPPDTRVVSLWGVVTKPGHSGNEYHSAGFERHSSADRKSNDRRSQT